MVVPPTAVAGHVDRGIQSDRGQPHIHKFFASSTESSSQLGLVGDLLAGLMAARSVRILVLVVELFLQLPLVLRRLRRVPGRFRRIVALFHGARVDGSMRR